MKKKNQAQRSNIQRLLTILHIAPPTLRQQCGGAVADLMLTKDISFTEMAKVMKISHNRLWWYLIGDHRGSPGKDMDLLEKLPKALQSQWIGPEFVFYKQKKSKK